MKNKDLGLILGTNEKSFYEIMTYQNTNNVDFLCAYILHVYEFLCIKNIQNIEIYKVNLYPYIHVHVHVLYMYTYMYTCIYIEYRSMHASNLEINNMRTRNAYNL